MSSDFSWVKFEPVPSRSTMLNSPRKMPFSHGLIRIDADGELAPALGYCVLASGDDWVLYLRSDIRLLTSPRCFFALNPCQSVPIRGQCFSANAFEVLFVHAND